MTYDWPTQLAYRKLGELNRLLRKLESVSEEMKDPKKFSDADEYKMLFSSFIVFARAVTFALQKEGPKLSGGFSKWYETKRAEMKENKILEYVLIARNTIEKTGEVPLLFTNEGEIGYKVGIRASDGARTFSGSEGSFWVENEGTMNQMDMPIRPDDPNLSRFSSLMKAVLQTIPESEHNKKCAAPVSDPLELCKQALAYYRKLVFDFNNDILGVFARRESA